MRKEDKKRNEMWKIGSEELQDYLHFQKLGFVKENKKGKGSYKREKKNYAFDEDAQFFLIQVYVSCSVLSS